MRRALLPLMLLACGDDHAPSSVDAPLVAIDAPLAPDSPPAPDSAPAPAPDSGSAPDAARDARVPDAASVPDAAPAPDAPPPPPGFTETFSVADSSAWPSPWAHLGGAITHSVAGNRGRLVPVTSGYALARMGVDGAWRDAEVTFDVSFEEITTQGVGFYLRQNGGWLRNTATHGRGYACFLEGFRGSRFGVWRELDGVEEEISAFTAFATPLASNTLYRVRFRVEQQSATVTRLRARVWRAADAEPSAWNLDVTDASAALQDVADGLAVDSYSSIDTGQVTAGATVDDIALVPLPANP